MAVQNPIDLLDYLMTIAFPKARAAGAGAEDIISAMREALRKNPPLGFSYDGPDVILQFRTEGGMVAVPITMRAEDTPGMPQSVAIGITGPAKPGRSIEGQSWEAT